MLFGCFFLTRLFVFQMAVAIERSLATNTKFYLHEGKKDVRPNFEVRAPLKLLVVVLTSTGQLRR